MKLMEEYLILIFFLILLILGIYLFIILFYLNKLIIFYKQYLQHKNKQKYFIIEFISI
jgi:hypothetical protein